MALLSTSSSNAFRAVCATLLPGHVDILPILIHFEWWPFRRPPPSSSILKSITSMTLWCTITCEKKGNSDQWLTQLSIQMCILSSFLSLPAKRPLQTWPDYDVVRWREDMLPVAERWNHCVRRTSNHPFLLLLNSVQQDKHFEGSRTFRIFEISWDRGPPWGGDLSQIQVLGGCNKICLDLCINCTPESKMLWDFDEKKHW